MKKDILRIILAALFLDGYSTMLMTPQQYVELTIIFDSIISVIMLYLLWRYRNE